MDELCLIRFMSKVNQTEYHWLWTAATNPKGYGRFRIDGVLQYPHILAYEHFIGPVPEGLQVHHLCNTPPCVRPTHLTVGPPEENSQYMAKCGRAGGQVLTEEQVRAILKDKRKGVVIAAEYGVLPTQISNIRRGVSWAHVC